MTVAINKYASKAYAEHPIAMWPLDEEAYYLSLIDDNTRRFTNWTMNPGVRTNYSNNPSTETASTPNWITAQTSILKSNLFSYTGGFSAEVTLANTSDTNLGYQTLTIPSTGTYAFSIYVYIPVGSPLAGQIVTLSFEGGTTTQTSISSSPATLVAGSWVRASRIYSVTAIGAGTVVPVTRISGLPSSNVGAKIYLDGYLLEKSASVGTYFDGDTIGGTWLGTAGTSNSTLINTAVTTTATRVNLAYNPSVETNATGWGGNACSSAQRDGAKGLFGSSSFWTTSTGTGTGQYYGPFFGSPTRIPVTPGKTYTMSIYIRDLTSAYGYRPVIYWWDAATGGTNPSYALSPTIQQGVPNDTGWTRFSVTGTVPAGISHCVLACYTDVNQNVNAGHQAWWDGLLFEEGNLLLPYFDGATANGTWTGTAHASVSNQVAATVSNSPTLPSASSPFDSTIYTSFTKNSTSAGTIEFQSTGIFDATTTSASIGTFCVNFFMYINPTFINWVKVGYRYTDANNMPQEVLSAAIPPPTLSSWANFNNTYTLPASWAGSLNLLFQVDFADSTAGDAASRTVIMNGLSVGQESETTCYESLGSTTVSIPTSFNLGTMTGVSADQYGVQSDNGYYLVRNNELLAKNDGFPIIYGTNHSTKIYQSGIESPSVVFPGKGMLHETGRNKNYALEMWMKIDPSTSTAKRIVGPMDSLDGLYVKEGFLSLVIGNEIGSYCVSEWYRPMLVHVSLRDNNATVQVNGEQVISIPFDRTSAVLPNTNDWWGIYSYAEIGMFEVDCISVYPYIISDAAAKRKFVYGQGSPSIQSIDNAYGGVPTTIEFATAEYDAGIIYPDIARWDAGYFNNLTATKDYLSVPDYKLPVINIGGRDINEWYADNLAVNTLEYPTGTNPRFITFRPNIVGGVWDVNGISYTENAYFNFPVMSILNNPLSAVYGVFQVDYTIATARTLISFANVINNTTFDINIENTTLKYVLNGTTIYSTAATIGTKMLVGINFDLAAATYGASVAQFFSSPSSIQVYVGGNGVNTFEGKIFSVGFCNDTNFSTVSTNFASDGIAIKGNYDIMIDHIASYTLLPEYEYGKMFLDISVSGEWEEYFPLSYFASYVKDANGNPVYDLDMLQLNLGYTTVASSSVWTYADLKAEFSAGTYNSIRTGTYSNYFNLMKKNTTGNSVNVSKSSLQSFITFQPLASGANTPLSSIPYTKALDASYVINADLEATVPLPDKAYQTKFAFTDNVIIYPPKKYDFNDYAMVVHFVINQRSILKNPLKVKSFEIVAKNLNYQPSSPTNTQRNYIGTKFGKKIYPSTDNYGMEDQKDTNPYVIYKTSTPYIYTTKKSGIRLLNESSRTYENVWENYINIPVNENASFNYKVAAMQFMVNANFTSGTDSIKFMEIKHKGGVYALALTKNGSTATVAAYTKPSGDIIDGGNPSGTSTINIYDAGGPTSVYTEHLNNTTGPSGLLSPLIDYAPLTGTDFYQNGRFVVTPVIRNDEWVSVGVVFPTELDFSEFSDGAITLFGGYTINNISYYLSDGLGTSATINTRTWQSVFDVDGSVPAGTSWSYWTGGTWQTVYVTGQSFAITSTPADIYDAYVGTNGAVVDDGYGVTMRESSAQLISGASWSYFSGKPA